ncbi:MAG TPA: EutN/CcmL family microcompartment protein [Phycisphaerae bacterium]|nr:EutN/CcmL family microcompartment protein [Phycisphaerae bacterium]
MWTGIVQGTVTSTIKHPSLTKGTMLIVQPIHPLTSKPDGLAQIVVDTLGAGLHQRVLVSGDGLGTQRLLNAGKDCPVRLSIAAILDEFSIQTRNGGAV